MKILVKVPVKLPNDSLFFPQTIKKPIAIVENKNDGMLYIRRLYKKQNISTMNVWITLH